MEKVNVIKNMMEQFNDCDAVFLEPFDNDLIVVTASPFRTVDRRLYLGMSVITSLEEVFQSGCPLATYGQHPELDEKIRAEIKRRACTAK